MSDRPILFSAPMIQALLAGRKTQTRRALKLPTKTFSGGPIYERPDMGGWEATTHGGGGCFTIGKSGERIPAPEQTAIWHRTTGVCMVTPIQVGDRLWVREAWHAARSLNNVRPRDISHDSDIEHAATARDYAAIGLKGKLRPGMFLPRWASRLTLTVTEVRVQRLHDISDEDAEAEGCPPCPRCHDVGWINEGPDGGYQCPAFGCGDSYRDQYARLWNSINGPGAWEKNPYVAAYTFTVERRKMEKPIYVRQTAEPMSPEESHAWFESAADDAKARGATFFRFSIHETHPNLRLIEGWRSRPDDQGEQRWSFAAPAAQEGE